MEIMHFLLMQVKHNSITFFCWSMIPEKKNVLCNVILPGRSILITSTLKNVYFIIIPLIEPITRDKIKLLLLNYSSH